MIISKEKFDSFAHWDMLTEDDEKEIHEFWYANGWVDHPYRSLHDYLIELENGVKSENY